MQLLGEPIELVGIARYLGVKADTQLIWSAEVIQLGKKVAQKLDMIAPPQQEEWPTRQKLVLLYKQLIRSMITRVRFGDPQPAATSGNCKFYNISVFAPRLTLFGTLGTDRITRILGSISCRPH
jgi:hypothetical protein